MDGKCSATNKDGRPCSALVWKDALCRWHHPEMAERLTEGRRRGGSARSNTSRARKALAGDVRDIADVKARLMQALRRVEAGTLEAGAANAMANLARAIVVVGEASAVEDLTRRLAELEAIATREHSA